MNYTGKRMWHVDKVECVESTPRFRERFLRSLGRRRLPRALVREILERSERFDAEGREKLITHVNCSAGRSCHQAARLTSKLCRGTRAKR